MAKIKNVTTLKDLLAIADCVRLNDSPLLPDWISRDRQRMFQFVWYDGEGQVFTVELSWDMQLAFADGVWFDCDDADSDDRHEIRPYSLQLIDQL